MYRKSKSLPSMFIRSVHKAIVLFSLVLGSLVAAGQPGVVPTLGKEFWIGFMFNPPTNPMQMNIFISSDVNTSGTVQVPLLGISIPFTVVANVTTTVNLSSADVMHTSSEVVENRGVLVTTADTVSVFAINFQTYSADASVIYPVQSLGTEYRIFSHRGLSFGQGNEYASEFLIVSSQDGTEVEITTTCDTEGGHAAGVPWVVQLDSGQSYQVKAVDGVEDLTGSTIIGTEASGSCRPFSVFSGTSCANVPNSCVACDHIFTQNLPRTSWGTRYHSVPFATTTSYAYRLMSDVDGTVIMVDGVTPIALDAGEWENVYDATAATCFTSDQPFAVAQYMQGVSCSGNGDPALLLLNAVEQRITDVTFATVESIVITDHYLNLVTSSTNVGSLTIDGIPIAASLFTAYPACPEVSYATLPISQGSHTLSGAEGFSAYIYGMGEAESYAYSVGSFSDAPILPVDTVLCGVDSTGAITLTAPGTIFDPYWSLYANPEDTLAVGVQYTFVPNGSDVYTVAGQEFLSGCSAQFLYSVEVADPPALNVTAGGAETIQVCAYAPVQLAVQPDPPGSYIYSWWPVADLSDPSIPNPIATPSTTTWFYSSVSTLNGCAVAFDSVLVTVVGGDVMIHEASPASTSLCLGDSVQFNVDIQQVVGADALNGTLGALWQNVAGGSIDAVCGAVEGDALYFNGPAPREAVTIGLPVPNGGTVRFALKVASGLAPCDNAEVGDNVLLQYSLTGGAPWVDIATYLEFNHPDLAMVDAVIPPAAYSANTFFRWTQTGTYAAGQDNWVLDAVTIAARGDAGLDLSWSPGADLQATDIADPWAFPSATGWYMITTTDPITACVYTDSVFVDVGEPFSIVVTSDTTLCDVAGILLEATPTSGSGHTWSWSPAATLTNATIENPTATPLATTAYAVEVTTEQGCVAQDTVTITVGQLLDLSVSVSPASICAGEEVQLTAAVAGGVTGVTHSWTPAVSIDDPSSASTTASPVVTTLFVDVVTDTLTGCVLLDSVLVEVTSLLNATATPDTLVCIGTGLQLQVEHDVPDPATITWEPAALLSGPNTATPIVQFDSTMVYTVMVTDVDGCSAFDTVLVTVDLSNIDILSDTAFCAGGSVLIDAGFPDYLHAWNTGATGQTLLADTSGSYTVTITSPEGCVRSHTTAVVVHPLPVVDLGTDPGLCVGESWTLDAGNILADHVWNTGATSQSITVQANGLYLVSVTDALGCSNADSVSLVFHPLPVIALTDTTVCVSEVITVDAGNPGSTYQWSTGETTRSIDVAGTSATLQVVVTTAENCADSADVSITFIPFPPLDLGPDTALCDGEAISFDVTGAGLTYLWSTGSQAPEATFTDDATVWSNVFNGYCTSTDTVALIFNPLPIARLAPSYETCLDVPPNRVLLDAGNDGCRYSWSTGDTTAVIEATEYGVHTVLITTPEGCSIEDGTVLLEYCPSVIHLPNGFTPNGDGVNDLFAPIGTNIATMELSIFDRWGQLIHTGQDANAFWDGTMDGTVVKDGVYVWRLICRFHVDASRTLAGPEEERTGHVTVLR